MTFVKVPCISITFMSKKEDLWVHVDPNTLNTYNTTLLTLKSGRKNTTFTLPAYHM